MDEIHSLHSMCDKIEAALVKFDNEPGATDLSGIADADLEDIATQLWQVIQQLQNHIIVPALVEADRRGLYQTAEYESAGSRQDRGR